jgi:hypothetical protein
MASINLQSPPPSHHQFNPNPQFNSTHHSNLAIANCSRGHHKSIPLHSITINHLTNTAPPSLLVQTQATNGSSSNPSTTTVNLSLPLNQTQAALFIVHNPSPNPPITAAVHIEAIKQTPPPC